MKKKSKIYLKYYMTSLSLLLLVLSLLSFTEFGERYYLEFEVAIWIIAVIFIIELLYRFVHAKKKLNFLKNSYFDIITIFPFEYLFGTFFRLPVISSLFRRINLRTISTQTELLTNVQGVVQSAEEEMSFVDDFVNLVKSKIFKILRLFRVFLLVKNKGKKRR